MSGGIVADIVLSKLEGMPSLVINRRGESITWPEITEVRLALAELIEAGVNLDLDRPGIECAEQKFCAPIMAKADIERFVMALKRVQGVQS